MKTYRVTIPEFSRVVTARTRDEALLRFWAEYENSNESPKWIIPNIEELKQNMDDTTRRSLQNLVDYLSADEEKSWLEADSPKTGHIFNDIIRLTEWLSAVAPKTDHETNP